MLAKFPKAVMEVWLPLMASRQTQIRRQPAGWRCGDGSVAKELTMHAQLEDLSLESRHLKAPLFPEVEPGGDR